MHIADRHLEDDHCQLFNPVDGGVHFDASHIAIGAGPGLGINAIRGVEWLDA